MLNVISFRWPDLTERTSKTCNPFGKAAHDGRDSVGRNANMFGNIYKERWGVAT